MGRVATSQEILGRRVKQHRYAFSGSLQKPQVKSSYGNAHSKESTRPAQNPATLTLTQPDSALAQCIQPTNTFKPRLIDSESDTHSQHTPLIHRTQSRHHLLTKDVANSYTTINPTKYPKNPTKQIGGKDTPNPQNTCHRNQRRYTTNAPETLDKQQQFRQSRNAHRSRGSRRKHPERRGVIS
jgi:hypothetical protein